MHTFTITDTTQLQLVELGFTFDDTTLKTSDRNFRLETTSVGDTCVRRRMEMAKHVIICRQNIPIVIILLFEIKVNYLHAIEYYLIG